MTVVSAGMFKDSGMFKQEAVCRDANGYWLHSSINPSEINSIDQLPEAEGMELIFITMQGSVSSERYLKYQNGDHNILDWNPCICEEGDWFLVGIYETEFGPEACFVTSHI